MICSSCLLACLPPFRIFQINCFFFLYLNLFIFFYKIFFFCFKYVCVFSTVVFPLLLSGCIEFSWLAYNVYAERESIELIFPISIFYFIFCSIDFRNIECALEFRWKYNECSEVALSIFLCFPHHLVSHYNLYRNRERLFQWLWRYDVMYFFMSKIKCKRKNQNQKRHTKYYRLIQIKSSQNSL